MRIHLHPPITPESQPKDGYLQSDSPEDTVAGHPLRSNCFQLPVRYSNYVVWSLSYWSLFIFIAFFMLLLTVLQCQEQHLSRWSLTAAALLFKRKVKRTLVSRWFPESLGKLSYLAAILGQVLVELKKMYNVWLALLSSRDTWKAEWSLASQKKLIFLYEFMYNSQDILIVLTFAFH